jgi:hypothetical protein
MIDRRQETTFSLSSMKVYGFVGLPQRGRLRQGDPARDCKRGQLKSGSYISDPGCRAFIGEDRNQPCTARIPQLDQPDWH